MMAFIRVNYYQIITESITSWQQWLFSYILKHS